MAQPKTARAGKMIVSIGNGATPEVFTAPCGFTSKALNKGKNLSEVAIPDCADPDAPFWLARDVQTLTASITGEGLLAAESIPAWLAFWDSNESRNVQIEIEFATGTLTYTGAMHLESWNIAAEQGGRVSSNVSLQSDGEFAGEWEVTP